MKAENTRKLLPKAKTKPEADNPVVSSQNGQKIRPEDSEFIRRMNAFTQHAGLLSDDLFYEVL